MTETAALRALAAASGHTDADAATILAALDAAGWQIVSKPQTKRRPDRQTMLATGLRC